MRLSIGDRKNKEKLEWTDIFVYSMAMVADFPNSIELEFGGESLEKSTKM